MATPSGLSAVGLICEIVTEQPFACGLAIMLAKAIKANFTDPEGESPRRWRGRSNRGDGTREPPDWEDPDRPALPRTQEVLSAFATQVAAELGKERAQSFETGGLMDALLPAVVTGVVAAEVLRGVVTHIGGHPVRGRGGLTFDFWKRFLGFPAVSYYFTYPDEEGF